VALLIAEQNLDFAASITRRAYIMDKGRIAHSTSREELLADKQRLHELLGV
jgi:ABC-type branched-subunit amino acid transport system ATPase component